jgi:hypothetical protein
MVRLHSRNEQFCDREPAVSPGTLGNLDNRGDLSILSWQQGARVAIPS